MKDKRDYDYVVGKVPRTDKNGNDITGDKLGGGGRHRKDGTYSGAAYDLKIVKDDPLKKMYDDEDDEDDEYDKYDPDMPLWGNLLVNLVGAVVDGVVSAGTDIACEAISNSKKNAELERQRKQEEQRQLEEQRKAYQENVMKSQQENTVQRKASSERSLSFPEIDDAYENYTINMTSEEAQKELVDAFIHYVLYAKKIWKLSHANIIDGEGNIITGKDMLNQICEGDLINSIDQILTAKPELLEEWQSVALREIMGRDVLVDSKYVPLSAEYVQLNSETESHKTFSNLSYQESRFDKKEDFSQNAINTNLSEQDVVFTKGTQSSCNESKEDYTFSSKYYEEKTEKDEKKNTLCVVYDRKDRIIFDELKSLVDGNDDDAAGGIVGTEDGTVLLKYETKDVWRRCVKFGKEGTLADKILIIDDKDSVVEEKDICFSGYGVKYSISSNKYIRLFIDDDYIWQQGEYDEFNAELKAMINLATGYVELPEPAFESPKKNKALLYAGAVLFPPALLAIPAVKLKEGKEDKEFLRKQRLLYGVAKLYYYDLDRFMKMKY